MKTIVHYHNKFVFIESDGTEVPFREEDQDKIMTTVKHIYALRDSTETTFRDWKPKGGASYEIEGGKEKEKGTFYDIGFFYDIVFYRYLPEKEEVKKECKCTGPWDCQCEDTLNSFYGKEVKPEKEESLVVSGPPPFNPIINSKDANPDQQQSSIHTDRPNEVYLKGWYTKENLQSYFKEPEKESQEELSNMVIYEWLRSKRYQTTYDENHEYKLYYELDLPKIINDAIKELTRKPK